MPAAGDFARAVELPGPWVHRYVAANGARFHVVEAEADLAPDAPLVLLLHGFPEFWWCWRAQLPVLADAGFRAVAMDLRGYGGSDKTPNGYDPITLGQDVSGVVKALGERDAVLVGHGWGGYIAWATAVLQPREVRAVAAVSAPHPATMLRALRRGGRIGALRHVLSMQVPMRPERQLADPASGFLRRHLAGWAAPGSGFPDEETVASYQRAISLWPAPHCALEYHRWLARSRLRADGRAFNRALQAPVRQPVLNVLGAEDPALPYSALADSRAHVVGPMTEHVLPGVGHFPPEESPDELSALLLGWLEGLPSP
jgi:pimeloyl-ACP methyl ester carboxylesterase